MNGWVQLTPDPREAESKKGDGPIVLAPNDPGWQIGPVRWHSGKKKDMLNRPKYYLRISEVIGPPEVQEDLAWITEAVGSIEDLIRACLPERGDTSISIRIGGNLMLKWAKSEKCYALYRPNRGANAKTPWLAECWHAREDQMARAAAQYGAGNALLQHADLMPPGMAVKEILDMRVYATEGGVCE